MKKTKVLMLYGNSYSSCGLDSLSETLSIIDSNISVDLIRNPLIALEKIKEYDLIIMGLIWSQNECKKVFNEYKLPSLQIRTILHQYNELINSGILFYNVIKSIHSIPIIIYDTVGCSGDFAYSEKITFFRVPELVKNIIDEIICITKKETV